MSCYGLEPDPCPAPSPLSYASPALGDGDSLLWRPSLYTSVQVWLLGYSHNTPWDALSLPVGTYEFATRGLGLLCIRGFVYYDDPFYAYNLRVTGIFTLTYLGRHYDVDTSPIPSYRASDFERGARSV